MSTIDGIMKAALGLVATHLLVMHGREARETASQAEESMRDMIAAALADARREGAEAMRKKAADVGYYAALSDDNGVDVADAIRAIPLPTGPRHAVLLTRQQIDDVMTNHYPLESLLRQNVDAFEAAVRDVEAAVLAANGLEVRRG